MGGLRDVMSVGAWGEGGAGVLLQGKMFVLIEKLPVCFNTQNKTDSLVVKNNNSI
jgi:hypothetical protein